MHNLFHKTCALLAVILTATGAWAVRVQKAHWQFNNITSGVSSAIPCTIDNTTGQIKKNSDGSVLGTLQMNGYTLTFGTGSPAGIKDIGLMLGGASDPKNKMYIGGLAKGDIVRIQLQTGCMETGAGKSCEVGGKRGEYLFFAKTSDDKNTQTQTGRNLDVFCDEIVFLDSLDSHQLTVIDKRKTSAGNTDTGYSVIESITIERAVLPADAVTDIDFTKGVQGEYVVISDESFTTPTGTDKYKVKFTSTSSSMTIAAKAGTYYVNAYGGAYSSTTTLNGQSLLGTQEANYSKKVTLAEDGDLVFTNSAGTNGQIYRLTITPEAVANLSVTLGKSGISTFTPPINVQIPSGVSAYKITAFSGTALTTVQLTGDIPASTGVILVGEGYQTYTFPLRDSYGKSAVTDNKLIGVIADTPIGGDGIYGLKANTTTFVPVQAGTTIPAGKAYLDLGSASSVKSLSLVLDETTALRQLQAAGSATPARVFTLQGVPVSSPRRGVYVADGKKVIVK